MSSNSTETRTRASTDATSSWWREPFMWMVVGGPLTVVVAGFATLGIAIAYPDPVIVTPSTGNAADQPAVQGRNHAASPKP